MPFVLRVVVRLTACCLSILLLIGGLARSEDRGGASAGPWDLETLRRPPMVTFVDRGNSISSLYYDGEPLYGKPTRVFAFLARPAEGTGPFPAIVLAHGGGGKAFKEWAALWAARGYVALAMDLAGQGPDGKRLPDGGPPQDDATKFQPGDVKDAWTYHAVADMIRGVSLLASLPNVDSKRLAITGISWGGYLTCIAAGLDDRLRVAVPVYGCGFLDENSYWVPILQKMPETERKQWIENFDPSRYLAKARMPMLFVNGTNDFAYPLDSYKKSYRLAKDRAVRVTVKMPHGHKQGWAPIEIGLFVDQYLRDGKPLPRIEAVERHENHIEVKVHAEAVLQSAALHYTTDTTAWKDRVWHSENAKVDGTTVKADLPSERPLVYFLTLTDGRTATVSTEHESLEK